MLRQENNKIKKKFQKNRIGWPVGDSKVKNDFLTYFSIEYSKPKSTCSYGIILILKYTHLHIFFLCLNILYWRILFQCRNNLIRLKIFLQWRNTTNGETNSDQCKKMLFLREKNILLLLTRFNRKNFAINIRLLNI